MRTLATLECNYKAQPRLDRIEIRRVDASPVERRPGVQVVVRLGNLPDSAFRQAPSPSATPFPSTPEERRQEWLRKEADAGQQRRQQRVEERDRERQELKREF